MTSAAHVLHLLAWALAALLARRTRRRDHRALALALGIQAGAGLVHEACAAALAGVATPFEGPDRLIFNASQGATLAYPAALAWLAARVLCGSDGGAVVAAWGALTWALASAYPWVRGGAWLAVAGLVRVAVALFVVASALACWRSGGRVTLARSACVLLAAGQLAALLPWLTTDVAGSWALSYPATFATLAAVCAAEAGAWIRVSWLLSRSPPRLYR